MEFTFESYFLTAQYVKIQAAQAEMAKQVYTAIYIQLYLINTYKKATIVQNKRIR